MTVRVPKLAAILVTLSPLVGCALEVGEQGEEVDFQPVAALAAPPDVEPPKPGEVTFARSMAERAHGVHIRDQAHRHPKVIYSVRLLAPSSAEQLRLRGEVVLSRCNPKDVAGQSGDASQTPCNSKEMRQSPYDYAPRFSAAFVLGATPSDASGERVSAWVDTTCSKDEHHCALALPEVAVKDVPNAAKLYVNLVVAADANGHEAKQWHVMEVEQNKGALAVTRLGAGPGARVLNADSTKLRAAGKLGIDRPKEDGDPTQVRQLMYQVALNGLKPGDVVDADAKMRAFLGNHSCDPLITGELVLTANPDSREAKGAHDAVLGARNGRNCADHSSSGCKYQKSGAVELKKGTPSTMYLSYVAVALRSCAQLGGGDKWWADPNGGFLAAGVRR